MGIFKFKKTSQLSFSQLRFRRKLGVKKLSSSLYEFLVFLVYYLNLKLKLFIRFVTKIPSVVSLWFVSFKFFVTRKLIWGRGRFIRPFVTIFVLVLSISVFLAGGLFQHKFVVANDYKGEFISGTGDILPEKITATTVLPSGRIREGETIYEVKPGDTLSRIGQEFGVTMGTIKYANSLASTEILKVGQKLTIPPVSGVIHTVVSGDTIDVLAKKYEVATQAIADFNYLNEPFTLNIGQKLIIPDAKIPQPPTPKLIPTPTNSKNYYTDTIYSPTPYAGDGTVGSGNFIWPARYRIITQYFSSYHPALDIAKPSPLYASDSGIVVRAGWWANGYGFAVQIDHRNGFVTTYGHMETIYVNVGDSVEQGEEIGMMGSTGRSTGPHVHFTIQYNGKFLDPLGYL